jgi:FtsP/CotA-like multicopper oxidase with cupredoxin domain
MWTLAKPYLPSLKRASTLGTLAFTLDNKLPAYAALNAKGELASGRQPTNIHTHGLIVSPGETGVDNREAYGDNVFVLACSARATGSNGDAIPPTPVAGASGAITSHCDMAASQLGAAGGEVSMHGHEMRMQRVPYSISVPAHQPNGLAWFHPHAHTLSGMQVAAGLSGLISVGDACSFGGLSASSRAAFCRDTPAGSVLRADIPVRTMILKDVQIAQKGTKQSAMGGSIAATCAGTANAFGNGWCKYSVKNATTNTVTASGVWLFTVNGQIAPDVPMFTGRTEIWRLANVTANTVYNLAICKNSATLQAMRDGAPATFNEQVDCAESDRIPFVLINQDGAPKLDYAMATPVQLGLVMMPGTRAEIQVTLPAGVDKAGLVQLGFKYPDTSPATVLASVSKAPAPRLAIARRTAAQMVALPPMTRSSVAVAQQAPALSAREQKHKLKETPLTVVVPLQAGPPKIVPVIFGKIVEADLRETLFLRVLQADPDAAAISACKAAIAAVAAALPPDDPRAGSMAGVPACNDFLGSAFDPTVANIKVAFGASVRFRLINLTSELHNFHIHQHKFHVDPPTTNAMPLARAGRPAAIQTMIERSATDIRRMQAQRGRPMMADGVTPELTSDGRVDSYPVEPVGSNGIDNVSMATIVFDKVEHKGAYVFHCHILEHEDKGMMNTITVQ